MKLRRFANHTKDLFHHSPNMIRIHLWKRNGTEWQSCVIRAYSSNAENASSVQKGKVWIFL